MAEPSASGVKIRKQSLEKLALPTMNGLDIVSIHEIIRCEADGNYTRVPLFIQVFERLPGCKRDLDASICGKTFVLLRVGNY